MSKGSQRKVLALLATSWLSPEQISWLSPEQISGLSPEQISWLSRTQISWLSPEQISWLSPEQISGLSRTQISWLSRTQISWLSPEQISGLSPEQISWLSRTQISWLSPEQISWLSPEQISGLSPEQISGLSRTQISWLSRTQISGLSPEQISWLSPEERELVKAKLDMDRVPLVENLYTQILKQIKSEHLTLDQSSFGESNRGQSVCGSPMCVGGTTVWLAGEEGYKLADKVGFSSAAFLIHLKSRPDVPPPRYDVYPNAWALAYIQERAAEEKASAK